MREMNRVDDGQSDDTFRLVILFRVAPIVTLLRRTQVIGGGWEAWVLNQHYLRS